MPDTSFPVGDDAWPGYLAVPDALPGPWPAVVVIHEAFGLNDDIRAKADEFAARGYLALAQDLFDGRSWIRCIRSAFAQLRAGRGRAFNGTPRQCPQGRGSWWIWPGGMLAASTAAVLMTIAGGPQM